MTTCFFKPIYSLAYTALLCLCSIGYSQQVKATDVSLYVVDANSYILGPYLSYLEDEEGKFTVDQVRELHDENDSRIQKMYDEVFNEGLSKSVYWFFLSLEFDDSYLDKNESWFIELENVFLQSSEIFIYSENKLIDYQLENDKTIGSDNIYSFRYPVFDVSNFKSKNIDIILRLDAQTITSFPLTLWKKKSLHYKNKNFEYWLGFYFGLMGVMAFYNLIIYFVIKDRSYLYFVAYVISMIFFFFSFSSSGREYVLNDISSWNAHVPLFSAMLSLAFYLKFSSTFVSLNKISARFNKIVHYCSLFLILLAFTSLINSFYLLNIVVYSILAIVFGIFYLAFYLRWHGIKEANILIVASFVLLISILIFTASMINLLPYSLFGRLSLYFGSALHFILLSIGLADQINIERRKRYQALIGENQAVQNMRKIEERSLEKAMLDPLTSLPNRAALERFSSELLDFKQGKREPLVVVFIHLHGYHEISHTLGFRSGDLLIEKVSSRLNRISGEFSDCVSLQLSEGPANFDAKVDSASFVLLFRLKSEKQKYFNDVEHLLSLLNRPVTVHDMAFDIKARAGVSFSPEHSTNIFTLVRFAQAAVESQPETERGKLAVYSNIVSMQGERKLKLINDLRYAIKNNELYLVFQPQLDIRSKKIISLESLVRWRHIEFGEVDPTEFVALAEKAGLIDALTDWVIKNSLDSLVWLLARGLKLRLAINISAKNLTQENFSQNLILLLDKHKLSPNILTLELTETSLMQDPENGIKVLGDLHEAGIVIAIDDFGAGYSSLSYIKQLPLSELKIDRSFVSQIDSDHSDRVITKSTITLAHEMGALVCAEGVESASCLKILEQFDCDIAQGFHIAKPLSKEDVVAWIDDSQFVT
jgi:EAL domain-containing protein (putative c-di-GMP-specific phosphodiesterase class I)/GGDEF domain-containing protein